MISRCLAFVFLSLVISASSWADVAFLNESQRIELFQGITSEISRLDAEGVITRDLVRATKWSPFAQSLEPSFENAADWDDLRAAFENLSLGFVNAHSHFSFYLGKSSIAATGSMNREIGYEYPGFHLFDVQTGYDIKAINGITISQMFPTFLDRMCPFNNEQSCANQFTQWISSGHRLFAGSRAQTLTLTEGINESTVAVQFSAPPKPPASAYCNQIANAYENFSILYKGYNLCIFQQGTVGLLRLRNFLYANAPSAPISIEDEINGALASLKANPAIQNLIFDLLGNPGGDENTPFLQAFSQQPFGELNAAFRKVSELDDPNRRFQFFYGVTSAETWFQNLISSGIYSGIPYESYLPSRPNFCRASPNCDNGLVPIRADAFKAKKIALLVDGRCISSCDDFTWRMNTYSGAFVAGLPQMADATYSRIKVSFILSASGVLSKQVLGQSGYPNLAPGDTLLADMVVPLTMTVDKNGKMLTAHPAKVDLVVPLTKKNFDIYPSFAANEVYKFLLGNR